MNKNINFNKNETELKMENSTDSFRQKNFMLQLIKESQIKSKAVITGARKRKKKALFVLFILSKGNFF